MLLFANVWCQYFCVYGLAAITSMVVKRENAALLGVIASLVAATLNGYGPSLKQGREWGVGWVQDSSFARWANEAWFMCACRGCARGMVFDATAHSDTSPSARSPSCSRDGGVSPPFHGRDRQRADVGV